MNRSAPPVASPAAAVAAAVAAAYHWVRAAMPLDLLPGRTPIVIWYCCRQPTIIARSFLPLLPVIRGPRLLCCETFPYQTTPLVGCIRLAAVKPLAKRVNNTKSAYSTANRQKWGAYGLQKLNECRATWNTLLATHGEGAYACTSTIGLSAAAENLPVRYTR